MTYKETIEKISPMELEEYETWFDEKACFSVNIDGITHPCIRLTPQKALLRDKSIHPVPKDIEIKMLKSRKEINELTERIELLREIDSRIN